MSKESLWDWTSSNEHPVDFVLQNITQEKSLKMLKDILMAHGKSLTPMPSPFTGPKMFCAGPKFLCQLKI